MCLRFCGGEEDSEEIGKALHPGSPRESPDSDVVLIWASDLSVRWDMVPFSQYELLPNWTAPRYEQYSPQVPVGKGASPNYLTLWPNNAFLACSQHVLWGIFKIFLLFSACYCHHPTIKPCHPRLDLVIAKLPPMPSPSLMPFPTFPKYHLIW